MIAINLSQLQDLSELVAVERLAGQKFYDHWHIEPLEDVGTLPAETLREAHDNSDLWVAEDDDKTVGFLAATSWPDALHIEEMSVMFDYQGQGIGRRLLDTVIAEAKARGCKIVTLTTDSEIPWNKPVYQRRGFTQTAMEDCPDFLAYILRRDTEICFRPETRIAMILPL